MGRRYFRAERGRHKRQPTALAIRPVERRPAESSAARGGGVKRPALTDHEPRHFHSPSAVRRRPRAWLWDMHVPPFFFAADNKSFNNEKTPSRDMMSRA